jgi:hypothetical protein
MTILLSFILGGVCFLQRAAFRILCKRVHGFDAYAHQFITLYLQEPGHRFYLPIRTERMGILMSEWSYPKFYHSIAALLPARFFPLADRFMGPFFDGLFSLAIFWSLLWTTQDRLVAASMVLVFIFTPSFSSVITLGPRMSSFTPRGFSEIMTNLYWLAYLFFCAHPHAGWFGLTVLCGAIVFWSSRFSVQALILTTLPLCVFAWDLRPLLFLACSFALAMLIARQVVWRSLSQQFSHLKWYCIQNLKGLMTVSDRNSIRLMWKALRAGQVRTLVNLLLVHNSYFIAVVRFPLAVIALGLVVYRMYLGGLSALDPAPALILAGFSIFLLTSQKWFLFIGEAERYLNHIAIAILLYSAMTIYPYAIWLCLWGAAYSLFDLGLAYYMERKDAKLERSDRIIDALKAEQNRCNVLEIPYGISGGYRIIVETHHNWLYHVFWSAAERKTFTEYMTKYPTMDIQQLPKVISEYKIQIVLVDTRPYSPEEQAAYQAACGLEEIIHEDHIRGYRTPLFPAAEEATD